jgi:hypothetical protein
MCSERAVFTGCLVFCEMLVKFKRHLLVRFGRIILWVMAISCSILHFLSDAIFVNILYEGNEQHTP